MSKKTKKVKAVKAPREPKAAVNGIEVGEVVSVEDISSRFKTRGSVGSRYDGLIETLKGMKPGQAIEVKNPDGVTLKLLHNRVTAGLGKFNFKDIGLRIRKRSTLDNTLTLVVDKA